MNIVVLSIGKTAFPYLKEGMSIYEKRLVHYTGFSSVELPDVKNASSLSRDLLKEKEGEAMLSYIKPTDEVILLDEKGKKFDSVKFSAELGRRIENGTKRLIFVIGGAYGFSDRMYGRANGKISLSDMTFSHQMVRLILFEQIYRSFTILKGEPYHHR